jgi:hypothetical protein
VGNDGDCGEPAQTYGVTAPIRTSIDRQLVDRAVWVPMVDVRAVEFVSKRVRNYQLSPMGGFIAARTWLR